MHTRKYTNSSKFTKIGWMKGMTWEAIHNQQTCLFFSFRLICLGNSTCTDCTDVNLPIITGAKGNQPKDKIRFVYINVYICLLVTVLPRSRTRGDLPSGATLHEGAGGQLSEGRTDGSDGSWQDKHQLQPSVAVTRLAFLGFRRSGRARQ